MRILPRYAMFEYLKVFLVTLTLITLMMMVVGVVLEAMRQNIGLTPTVRILPYLLPEALRFAVPGAALFAASSAYGRLGAFNEVLAVKALGISPMVLLWPVLMFALLLSLFSVWLNNLAVTWGRQGVQRVVVQSVEQIAYGMLRSQRSYSCRQMSMNVRSVSGRTLLHPTLTVAADGENPGVTITADEAELHSNPAEGTLTIRFYNAMIEVGNGSGRITYPGTYEHVVELSDWSKVGGETGGPSNCPMGELPRAIQEQEQAIVAMQQEAAAGAALSMMTGDVEDLFHESRQRTRNKIAAAQRTLDRLRTEAPRRWANGASCFCFVFVGAPMAIRRRNGEFLTSFFLCFLPILLVYYPLLIGAVKQAKSGAWPPESVWLGNLMLLAWGWWLLTRVRRY